MAARDSENMNYKATAVLEGGERAKAEIRADDHDTEVGPNWPVYSDLATSSTRLPSSNSSSDVLAVTLTSTSEYHCCEISASFLHLFDVNDALALSVLSLCKRVGSGP